MDASDNYSIYGLVSKPKKDLKLLLILSKDIKIKFKIIHSIYLYLF